MSQPVGEAVPGWAPPPAPQRGRLEGRRVAVSPLTRDAFPGLWKAFSEDDGTMWTYMGVGPFAARSEMEEAASRWLASHDPLFVSFEVNGEPRGWGSYLRMKPEQGAIEVGHLAFAPSLRRTAAATEAMYLMMRHAFDLGYRRYEWKCDSLNAPSRRAAERLGFVYEGTFRQHMVYKGRNRDTAWYSIIDREWPRIRLALETWLQPANFDSSGRQRRRLSEIRQGPAGDEPSAL